MIDIFCAVAISVFLLATIEPVTGTAVFQRRRTIDEAHGVVDIVFFAQFDEERVRSTLTLVRSSFVCGSSLVAGSAAAYSQYCSSVSRITVSSAAT